MGIEKRKHPRIPLKLHVEYRGKSVFQRTQCHNLSKGGMFLATDKIESPGSHIEIIFEIGDNPKRVIQAQAVVRWRRTASGIIEDGTFLPPGMGVQFVKVFPSNGIKILEDLIKNQEGT